MSTPKNSVTGPISDVLRPTRESEDEPMLTDPAQLLADLVDLRGSVVLAQYISGEQDGPSPQPSHPQSILALVAKTVEDVRSRLEFARENAFRPRFRLPTSQRAWNVLQRTYMTPSDGSKNAKERKAALKSATRIMWAPFAEFLEVQLKRSRFALKELREELSGPLAGLGPEVAAIERMDFALRQAIDAEVTRLYQRIGTYCEQSFQMPSRKHWQICL